MIKPEIRFLISEIQRLEETLTKCENALSKYNLRTDTGLTFRIKSAYSIEIQKSLNRVELNVEEIKIFLNWLKEIMD